MRRVVVNAPWIGHWIMRERGGTAGRGVVLLQDLLASHMTGWQGLLAAAANARDRNQRHV